ncbi:MAG: M20 family metallopeptidase [Rubricoccaceae bacterium]
MLLPAELAARVRALADEAFPEAVRLRRAFHRRPELAFEERETAARVAEALRGLGLTDVRTGVARTGVVAHVRGARPGPTVALRADMDALPIHEATGLPFASETPGVMHACGHDAHTAMLLGVARVLVALRDELAGTIRLLFQPSEEKLPGGAQVMMAEGALDALGDVPAPVRIFGQHVFPGLPSGTLGVRSGPFMASADELYLTVRGRGGHAAAPHQLADPVLAQAHVLTALQAVVSRERPPDQPTVLSFGRVLADGATNVIPDAVRIEGTLRAVDETWRRRAHALIRRTAARAAEALGCTCEAEIRVGYPALINDAAATADVRAAAVAFAGEDGVVDLPPWYASEDFAWYAQQIPGVFYVLGTASDEPGSAEGLHTPRFTITEGAMQTGIGFMAALALSTPSA